MLIKQNLQCPTVPELIRGTAQWGAPSRVPGQLHLPRQCPSEPRTSPTSVNNRQAATHNTTCKYGLRERK
uniref:Uncharacterized protein n=1 Tax=Knipowitschia caucasica TaxID=637954 RepID=A0AAV2LUV8_KNICA